MSPVRAGTHGWIDLFRLRNACLSAELRVQASIKGRMYPLLLTASGFCPEAFCVCGNGSLFQRFGWCNEENNMPTEPVNGREPDFSEDDPARRAWTTWRTWKERPGEDDASAG